MTTIRKIVIAVLCLPTVVFAAKMWLYAMGFIPEPEFNQVISGVLIACGTLVAIAMASYISEDHR